MSDKFSTRFDSFKLKEQMTLRRMNCLKENEIYRFGFKERYNHKINIKEILKPNDYPTDTTTEPKAALQDKIDYYFKPYNGEQEFSNFMRFSDYSNE